LSTSPKKFVIKFTKNFILALYESLEEIFSIRNYSIRFIIHKSIIHKVTSEKYKYVVFNLLSMK